MAEGQPHLSIQMSDLNTNDTPSRKQSSANLAVRGGSILTFHNISYHVKMKTGFLCCQKPADKEVLRDVKTINFHNDKLKATITGRNKYAQEEQKEQLYWARSTAKY